MDSHLEAVVTDPPTNAEHPALYERTVMILGAIAVLCIIGVVALAIMGKDISEGLIAIGASAVGGLVALLTPQQ